MSIQLERPPTNEPRKEWADWFFKVHQILTALEVPTFTDATRGAAGRPGRVIFNSTDSNLNFDNGTNWILPDGTVT